MEQRRTPKAVLLAVAWRGALWKEFLDHKMIGVRQQPGRCFVFFSSGVP
jgi:hypothetical protein